MNSECGTKSRSQPITARGSGGALKALPVGSGAEPHSPAILVNYITEKEGFGAI